VHVDIPGACGDRRDVLHRIFLNGLEEIHGSAQGAKEVPVRSGDSVGRSFQAAGHVGLDSCPRNGRRSECRVAHRPDGRAALQWLGREAHRAAEEVPGGYSEQSQAHAG
jgi:hypothetical protein